MWLTELSLFRMLLNKVLNLVVIKIFIESFLYIYVSYGRVFFFKNSFCKLIYIIFMSVNSILKVFKYCEKL